MTEDDVSPKNPFPSGTAKKTVHTRQKGRNLIKGVSISGSETDDCVRSKSMAPEIGPGSLEGDKKNSAKRDCRKRKIAANKEKNAATKEE